jgi:amino acid permease
MNDIAKRLMFGIALMVLGIYMYPSLKTMTIILHDGIYSFCEGTPLHEQGLVWAVMGFLPIAFAIGWIVMPLINAMRDRKSRPPKQGGYGKFIK